MIISKAGMQAMELSQSIMLTRVRKRSPSTAATVRRQQINGC